MRMLHARELRDYTAHALLRDGDSILVRAVKASDKPLLLELFHGLSEESVRHRAFGSKKGLTQKEVAYLTELDFVQHVALAAILPANGEERMIGVGRYIRTHAHGVAVAPAEIAFAVVDEYQAHGVGTLLLEHLARIASAEGVDELHAEVMADNTRMMDVFRKSGFVTRTSLHDGIYDVAFPTGATKASVDAGVARKRHATAARLRHES